MKVRQGSIFKVCVAVVIGGRGGVSISRKNPKKQMKINKNPLKVHVESAYPSIVL